MDGLAVDPLTGAALPRGASDTDYSFHSFMSMSMAFEYDWGGDTPGGWGKFRGWLKKFTVGCDAFLVLVAPSVR